MTPVCSIFSRLLQLISRSQFNHAVKQHEAERGGPKFRFMNKLMSLDGSIIELSATMFDWAKYRRRKGAIKLHLLLNHDGCLPSFAAVTEGKHGELQVARSLQLEPGAILAIDRGCKGYKRFAEMTQNGIFFVTRMKAKSGWPLRNLAALVRQQLTISGIYRRGWTTRWRVRRRQVNRPSSYLCR